MKVNLAYGQGGISIDLPEDRTTVIAPSYRPGLADERLAVLDALRKPIGTEALLSRVPPGSRICIVFTDITRATPNDRIIPWLLDHLADIPPERVTLLNATGTHRPNTRAELETMLTPRVVERYRVLNHECRDEATMIQLGTTREGVPAMINRHLVEADVRIVTGFIEPHFFAGFSGGPKGIMPGVAGLTTVVSNHGTRNIAHPQAGFGVTEGNPLWEEMRDIALRVGPSFLLNVTLNEERQITGVFAGDLLAAHRAGIEWVRKSAMQRVEAPFDVVVTTNSGYPLDMNLYQGVKGMSAGARILRRGGLLILACECREGVPPKSAFEHVLHSAANPAAILAMLAGDPSRRPEQWQAQIQAIIQSRARVQLHSMLPDEVVRAAHLTPCPDIGAAVRCELAEAGPAARVAVLPQGPLTIPYLAVSETS